MLKAPQRLEWPSQCGLSDTARQEVEAEWQARNAPAAPVPDDVAALRRRVASLERRLAATEQHPQLLCAAVGDALAQFRRQYLDPLEARIASLEGGDD